MKQRALRFRLVLAALLSVLLIAAGCGGGQSAEPAASGSAPASASTATAPSSSAASSSDSASATRTITDMAGRQVTLPAKITKVVTLGSVPVINSFIFALGKGDTIVNGLPPFAQTPLWKYQTVIAPNVVDKPVMQGVDYAPQIEVILNADPDVVFVMEQTNIKSLEQRGLNVVFLTWREPEDIKKVVALLGDVFNEPERATEYTTYFDSTIRRIHDVTSTIPEDQRVTVLYANIDRMASGLLIAEWWISTAGGISVTGDERPTESVTFTLEQMLSWDPDVLIVSKPKDRETLLSDPRFASLNAVKNDRIYMAPVGAHKWANRTSEEPLTVLWAATTFYPEMFRDWSLPAEAKSFYQRFYGTTLTDAQVQEILNPAG